MLNQEISLVDLAGPYPLIRRFISRVLYLTVSSLEMIESVFPSSVLREWIVYVKHIGPLGDLEKLPYKCIIVETDQAGNIIGSIQNENGPVIISYALIFLFSYNTY